MENKFTRVNDLTMRVIIYTEVLYTSDFHYAFYLCVLGLWTLPNFGYSKCLLARWRPREIFCNFTTKKNPKSEKKPNELTNS